jgi:hypothetical protein
MTNNVYPPIPVRDFDWCAWYADEGEEAGRYGWGSSEVAAIADLETRYGEGGE